MSSHDVSYIEVVVDALNMRKKIVISFPSDYDEQMRIAGKFAENSSPAFDNDDRSVDGILNWTSRPSKHVIEKQK